MKNAHKHFVEIRDGKGRLPKKIILKRLTKLGYTRNGLIWLRAEWRSLVKTVLTIPVQQKGMRSWTVLQGVNL